jgi:type IV pilus assembly protein PilP
MKYLLPIFISLLLLGCGEVKRDDLITFVMETKQKTYPFSDQPYNLAEIEALPFTLHPVRDPFFTSSLDLINNHQKLDLNCLAPMVPRKKEALEEIAVDNILMRGTLNIEEQRWAIVEVPENHFYKIKKGDYLGLNNGYVTNVTQTHIELLELKTDEHGCWKKQITEIKLLLK